MPHRPRASTGNFAYHALNRAVGRATLFEGDADDAMFVRVMDHAVERSGMSLLGWCAMASDRNS